MEEERGALETKEEYRHGTEALEYENKDGLRTIERC